MKPFLSSSEYPAPWIILICFINVDFPDSPVPKISKRCKMNKCNQTNTVTINRIFIYHTRKLNIILEEIGNGYSMLQNLKLLQSFKCPFFIFLFTTMTSSFFVLLILVRFPTKRFPNTCGTYFAYFT